jgi:protein tyrosine phosphatase
VANDLGARDGNYCDVNTVHRAWSEQVCLLISEFTLLFRCYQYFPSGDGEKTRKFGQYTVELLEETTNESYTFRKLKVYPKKDKKAERIVHHFQFNAWPDFEVAEEDHFMEFVTDIRALDDSLGRRKPILSHCSAGIGRTGTYVATDIMFDALKNGTDEVIPPFEDLLLQMRKSRMWLIQVCIKSFKSYSEDIYRIHLSFALLGKLLSRLLRVSPTTRNVLPTEMPVTRSKLNWIGAMVYAND